MTRAEKLLQQMGIFESNIHSVNLARTPEEATQKLSELKAKFTSGFNMLALKLHPDKTQDDPGKTEDFKVLLRLKKDFTEMRIPTFSPPRPSPIIVGFHFDTPSIPLPVREAPRYYPNATTAPRGKAHPSSWYVANMSPRGK